MKKYFNNIDGGGFIQLALIVGIVILAANDVSGWGWLVFCLILTFFG